DHGKAPPRAVWSAIQWEDNDPGAQTVRPGAAGPVRGLLGGTTSPAALFQTAYFTPRLAACAAPTGATCRPRPSRTRRRACRSSVPAPRTTARTPPGRHDNRAADS